MKKHIIPALLAVSLLMGGLNLYFIYTLKNYDKTLTQAAVQTNQYAQNLDVIIANMIELQPVLKDELITRLGQTATE